MIALTRWIEPSTQPNKCMHREPESLLCLGLVFLTGLVCMVMAWRAQRGR